MHSLVQSLRKLQIKMISVCADNEHNNLCILQFESDMNTLRILLTHVALRLLPVSYMELNNVPWWVYSVQVSSLHSSTAATGSFH